MTDPVEVTVAFVRSLDVQVSWFGSDVPLAARAVPVILPEGEGPGSAMLFDAVANRDLEKLKSLSSGAEALLVGVLSALMREAEDALRTLFGVVVIVSGIRLVLQGRARRREASEDAAGG